MFFRLPMLGRGAARALRSKYLWDPSSTWLRQYRPDLLIHESCVSQYRACTGLRGIFIIALATDATSCIELFPVKLNLAANRLSEQVMFDDGSLVIVRNLEGIGCEMRFSPGSLAPSLSTTFQYSK